MRSIYFIPLVIFIVVGILLGGALFWHKQETPSALLNKPVPEFSLPSPLENEPGLSTADLKGKYSLVNLFASWCVSCKVEHPLLMELSKQNIVPIYGISWRDKPENTRKLLEEHGNPFTAIGNDFKGNVVLDFGITGAPETFVINPEGKIIYKHLGPLTPDVIKDVILPMVKQ